MRPENPINDNQTQVDEKEQLRNSIQKSCRAHTILYSIAALIFLGNGIIHLDQVNDSKLYLCPLIAVMLVSTFAMAVYAIVYDRIRRATTAREMQQHLNLLSADTVFSKLIITTMALCLSIAAVLGLIDKSPWYVTVLAGLGVAGAIGGFWWLLKYTGKADPRDEDIEKLLTLEEKEK